LFSVQFSPMPHPLPLQQVPAAAHEKLESHDGLQHVVKKRAVTGAAELTAAVAVRLIVALDFGLARPVDARSEPRTFDEASALADAQPSSRPDERIRTGQPS
jgi:hypothetical protein